MTSYLLSLLCALNAVFWQTQAAAQAGSQSSEPSSEMSASQVQVKFAAAIKPLEGKVQFTDLVGNPVNIADLTKDNGLTDGLILHANNINIRASVQPDSEAKNLLVFLQLLDDKNQATDHFTQLTLDPSMDPARSQVIIDDAARLLLSDSRNAADNVLHKNAHIKVSSNIEVHQRAIASNLQYDTYVIGIIGVVVGVVVLKLVLSTIFRGIKVIGAIFVLIALAWIAKGSLKMSH